MIAFQPGRAQVFFTVNQTAKCRRFEEFVPRSMNQGASARIGVTTGQRDNGNANDKALRLRFLIGLETLNAKLFKPSENR